MWSSIVRNADEQKASEEIPQPTARDLAQAAQRQKHQRVLDDVLKVDSRSADAHSRDIAEARVGVNHAFKKILQESNTKPTLLEPVAINSSAAAAAAMSSESVAHDTNSPRRFPHRKRNQVTRDVKQYMERNFLSPLDRKKDEGSKAGQDDGSCLPWLQSVSLDESKSDAPSTVSAAHTWSSSSPGTASLAAATLRTMNNRNLAAEEAKGKKRGSRTGSIHSAGPRTNTGTSTTSHTTHQPEQKPFQQQQPPPPSVSLVGFPDPFSESGFASIQHWAENTFYEMVVSATGRAAVEYMLLTPQEHDTDTSSVVSYQTQSTAKSKTTTSRKGNTGTRVSLAPSSARSTTAGIGVTSTASKQQAPPQHSSPLLLIKPASLVSSATLYILDEILRSNAATQPMWQPLLRDTILSSVYAPIRRTTRPVLKRDAIQSRSIEDIVESVERELLPFELHDASARSVRSGVSFTERQDYMSCQTWAEECKRWSDCAGMLTAALEQEVRNSEKQDRLISLMTVRLHRERLRQHLQEWRSVARREAEVHHVEVRSFQEKHLYQTHVKVFLTWRRRVEEKKRKEEKRKFDEQSKAWERERETLQQRCTALTAQVADEREQNRELTRSKHQLKMNLTESHVGELKVIISELGNRSRLLEEARKACKRWERVAKTWRPMPALQYATVTQPRPQIDEQSMTFSTIGFWQPSQSVSTSDMQHSLFFSMNGQHSTQFILPMRIGASVHLLRCGIHMRQSEDTIAREFLDLPAFKRPASVPSMQGRVASAGAMSRAVRKYNEHIAALDRVHQSARQQLHDLLLTWVNAIMEMAVGLFNQEVELMKVGAGGVSTSTAGSSWQTLEASTSASIAHLFSKLPGSVDGTVSWTRLRYLWRHEAKPHKKNGSKKGAGKGNRRSKQGSNKGSSSGLFFSSKSSRETARAQRATKKAADAARAAADAVTLSPDKLTLFLRVLKSRHFCSVADSAFLNALKDLGGRDELPSLSPLDKNRRGTQATPTSLNPWKDKIAGASVSASAHTGEENLYLCMKLLATYAQNGRQPLLLEDAPASFFQYFLNADGLSGSRIARPVDEKSEEEKTGNEKTAATAQSSGAASGVDSFQDYSKVPFEGASHATPLLWLLSTLFVGYSADTHEQDVADGWLEDDGKRASTLQNAQGKTNTRVTPSTRASTERAVDSATAPSSLLKSRYNMTSVLSRCLLANVREEGSSEYGANRGDNDDREDPALRGAGGRGTTNSAGGSTQKGGGGGGGAVHERQATVQRSMSHLPTRSNAAIMMDKFISEREVHPDTQPQALTGVFRKPFGGSHATRRWWPKPEPLGTPAGSSNSKNNPLSGNNASRNKQQTDAKHKPSDPRLSGTQILKQNPSNWHGAGVTASTASDDDNYYIPAGSHEHDSEDAILQLDASAAVEPIGKPKTTEPVQSKSETGSNHSSANSSNKSSSSSSSDDSYDSESSSSSSSTSSKSNFSDEDGDSDDETWKNWNGADVRKRASGKGPSRESLSVLHSGDGFTKKITGLQRDAGNPNGRRGKGSTDGTDQQQKEQQQQHVEDEDDMDDDDDADEDTAEHKEKLKITKALDRIPPPLYTAATLFNDSAEMPTPHDLLVNLPLNETVRMIHLARENDRQWQGLARIVSSLVHRFRILHELRPLADIATAAANSIGTTTRSIGTAGSTASGGGGGGNSEGRSGASGGGSGVSYPHMKPVTPGGAVLGFDR